MCASIVLLARTVWTYNQEQSLRIFVGLPTILTEDFLTLSRQKPGQYFEVGNNRHLPNPHLLTIQDHLPTSF